MLGPPTPDDDPRGRVGYVDVIMTFGALVAIAATAPWTYKVIDLIDGVVDPLSGVLLQLFVPSLLIALILSMGVSARSRS